MPALTGVGVGKEMSTLNDIFFIFHYIWGDFFHLLWGFAFFILFLGLFVYFMVKR